MGELLSREGKIYVLPEDTAFEENEMKERDECTRRRDEGGKEMKRKEMMDV